ncbi:malonyl-ACP O-methyltransferase BioC [Erwinia psidii]|uniref:Malonyl-[acyl-carrier protein] O-methyltransferase n=1 Tax=Erwinia psidii TaxID=69224 RepID=A0A3N6SAI9_9GAMM|nr:malonyl-ACP O-methyltransferase BioC [Erwinia psidii]MCX8957261.1 malonyl-[acyl-carrier protein] O-methyltransferase BioC [Erwinia psidii]MCX8959631.1 malonyl-[acyl-carrier protein] O-methyltransferase BioC [Erwinia psidii]MCX8964574.1 malonyl-[acyl-carrier protein] O-methyltransferase BioC [Erwinia psidii]RQM38310.1 malonyl-[acyl-carrier protein] O-methyltransferase BioC [Erwinia psidii]
MLQTVNKQAIARAFGRAASGYDQYAELQRRSGEQLASYARWRQGRKILDAGCGTGWFSQRWRRAGNQVTALDLSAEMLFQARSQQAADHYQPGDIEALPFAEPQFDLCWSNLAVQWCSDLSMALQELRRVTLPGGQVLFSTLAAGSLSELNTAWQVLDLNAPVNRFLTVDAIREAGQSLGAQLHQQTLTLAFPDLLSTLRSLKGTGATHLHQGRDGMILSRRHLQQLTQHWPRDRRGFLLSYHLVYGVIDCD